MSLRRAIWGLACLLSIAPLVVAQQGKDWRTVPAPSPAVDRGQNIFVANCSFCHGPDGSGKTGPDLLRSPLVNHDEDGKQIGAVVHGGRGDGKMPPFPSLTDSEISDISAFLHYRTRAVVARFGYVIQGLVTGDVKAGEAYFDRAGKCNTCHSPTGDLSGIAKKYQPEQLQYLFLSGENGDNPVHKQVTVTLPSGGLVSGTLENLDEFNVALHDSSGQYRSWSRDGIKVEVHDPLADHHQLLHEYTDADIHNLLAYLETLK